MNLQHINVKLFLAQGTDKDLDRIGEVFSAWIQAQDFDELLVDVADYRHVFQGPGVLLIGHEADYSLDNAGGRLGLLYNRKASTPGSTGDRLRQAIGAALRTARRLEQEHGLRFETQQLLILANDRLLTPNTEESLSALLPELQTVLDLLYNGAALRLSRNPDSRERFNVTVTTAVRPSIEQMLANIGALTGA
jgi:hypothetical protein